jgi:hypothetical protein
MGVADTDARDMARARLLKLRRREPRGAVMPKLKRWIWRDGDTYLVLGLMTLLCGVAILNRAAVPENWVVVVEEAR